MTHRPQSPDDIDHPAPGSALSEARLMLETVLNSIPVRVFWKDRDCVYQGCNQLFAQDAGVDGPADLVGKTDHDMGWSEQAELYRADDFAVMESGEGKIGYEEPQTTPTGERIWLRTSKIPLHNHQGEVVGVLGTYEDITISKKAEEDRRQFEASVLHAQKLESLGILAGGIAHDFNNLLVAVLGHADLALEEMASDAGGKSHLQEIRTAAKRARDLTNQMLAYSGKGRFVVRRLDLSHVVEEMSQLLEASIPKKVGLHRKLAGDLPAVEVDVAQIRQVVMNLVTNAAESMEAGGRITLRTDRHEVTEANLADMTGRDYVPAGHYVVLEVVDDGCGMDGDTHARLFEPFFTTKFQGRGLGLAAVLGIVRGHGGTIEVETELDRGSTFRVLLPADQSGEPVLEPTEPKHQASGPLTGTVLVVDDEESVRRVAGSMLEHEGFDVVSAADGVEALSIYRERRHEIRIVLLDMTMPRMDGEETFRELRALDPDVRVILTSGYNEQDATSRFVGAGLAGFIQKPFTLDDLRTRLREALA